MLEFTTSRAFRFGTCVPLVLIASIVPLYVAFRTGDAVSVAKAVGVSGGLALVLWTLFLRPVFRRRLRVLDDRLEILSNGEVVWSCFYSEIQKAVVMGVKNGAVDRVYVYADTGARAQLAGFEGLDKLVQKLPSSALNIRYHSPIFSQKWRPWVLLVAIFLGIGVAGPLRNLPAARAGCYALLGIVFLVQARANSERKGLFYGLGVFSIIMAILMLVHTQTASPS